MCVRAKGVRTCACVRAVPAGSRCKGGGSSKQCRHGEPVPWGWEKELKNEKCPVTKITFYDLLSCFLNLKCMNWIPGLWGGDVGMGMR